MMYPRLIQPILSPEIIQGPNSGVYGQRGGTDPCLVLTSDPKPRLRWTADLHERFIDAVTQLGGPSSQHSFSLSFFNFFFFFLAIMRTMGVKGLTLFHLKSHLQKYRLGKQSGKEFGEVSKDGSYLMDSPRAVNSPQNLQTSDVNEGYEVKEALRAQMEVQSKLHLQVEAEKHVQLRQDAEKKYMAMLEQACKMLADQILGATVTNDNGNVYHGKETKAPPSASHNQIGSYPSQSADELGIHGSREVAQLHPQRADCSTESCLTSHESPVGFPREGSPPGGKRSMLNMDSANGAFLWGESDVYTPDLHLVHVSSQGIAGCGV
ncbi:hypothetical protein ACJIZ3_012863 [Penstemon smallii]|uniref:MYB-CC type transcription factor LHEQLE-containing domain-containing protein n=1 Tax=Penstemon smallii TaxID=265156 RepID=A0ABD3UQC7_9LAMI